MWKFLADICCGWKTGKIVEVDQGCQIVERLAISNFAQIISIISKSWWTAKLYTPKCSWETAISKTRDSVLLPLKEPQIAMLHFNSTIIISCGHFNIFQWTNRQTQPINQLPPTNQPIIIFGPPNRPSLVLSRFTTSQVLAAVGPNGFMSVAAICVALRHLLQLERQLDGGGKRWGKVFFDQPMVNCWFGSVVWDWNWNFYILFH